MPANIEIKARVRNRAALREAASRLSDTPAEAIPQVDTFFMVPRGRLKLRELASDRGQLIYYERSDQEGPKRSDYQIYNTEDPASLKEVLALAYGTRGVVKKVRWLYMIGQTRLHLDEVEGLGSFMELEVILQPGQSDAEGRGIAERLLEELGIPRGDLLESAYMDMLEAGEQA
jgi:predicted adenylyl cyclase CyaB